MIVVRFYAWIKENLGFDKLTINTKLQTIQELFLELKKILKEKSSVLFDNDQIKRGIMIGINNKLVRLEKPENIRLNEDDVVDIMPLGSGG